MVNAALSVLAAFALLVIGEALWRAKILKAELGRKFIHITVGTFVAFWPFYMSFRQIQLIAVAFFVVVTASRSLNIFKSIHAIDRKTWGDVLFAIGILLASSITSSKWIFLAAILHLSLADGLAAVIGSNYGKKHQYKVLGFTKSVVGTATFWLVSLLILITVITLGGANYYIVTFTAILLLPLTATAIENIAVYGLDNLFVPLLIVVVLSQMSFTG